MGQRFSRHARRFALGCAIAVAGASSGCAEIKSWFGLDTPAYKKNAPVPVKLEVPPDLAPQVQDDHFTVPQTASAAAAAAAAKQAAAPQTTVATAAGSATATGTGGAVAPTSAKVRIERDGAQRWLAVDAPPESTYAGIKDFLGSSDIAIARDDPQLGLLETGWADRRAKDPDAVEPGILGMVSRALGGVMQHLSSTGLRDKYRFRVERTDDGHSLVFVTYRGLEEVYTSQHKDQTTWQPAPASPDLEAEMLQRLLIRFSGLPTLPVPTAQLPTPATQVAAAAPAAPTVTDVAPVAAGVGQLVTTDKGRVYAIDIEEPFDRSWRQVGLALDRGGFTIEDRDRSKGLYFVRYIDPDYESEVKAKQGWIGRMFGRDTKISAQQFRIMVAANETITRVSVQNSDGDLETSVTSERIINLLHEQMR